MHDIEEEKINTERKKNWMCKCLMSKENEAHIDKLKEALGKVFSVIRLFFCDFTNIQLCYFRLTNILLKMFGLFKCHICLLNGIRVAL